MYNVIYSSAPNTGSVNQEKFKIYCNKKYSDHDKRKAREKLELAARNLLLLNPFFGIILTKQKLVEASDWLPTAAVDGVHLYYNVGFVNELRTKAIQFLICHEMLHLIYGHLLRKNYPNGLPRISNLFNIANDYIVNADSKYALSRKSKEAEYPTSIYINEEYAGLTSEAVYEILVKKVKEQIQQNIETNGGNGNEKSGGGGQGDGSGSQREKGSQGNSGNSGSQGSNDYQEDDIQKAINDLFPEGTFDEHLDLSGNGSGQNDDDIKEDSDGNLSSSKKPSYSKNDIEKNMDKFKGDILIANESMSEADRKAGMIPAGVERVIRELQNPVLSWRRYVRKYVLGVKKTQTSWMRAKRRSFDSEFVFPGKKPEKTYKIHVSLDTSGSITEEELRDFLSEVYGAAKQLKSVEITIWTFDTKVYNVQKYTTRNIHKLKKYNIYGNGGTAFLVNWEYMKENKIKPDLFIMFTDGYYGDAPGIANYCPTMYVIHGKHRPDIPSKYGKVIKYEKDQRTTKNR